ncbi:hypothetical protein D3C78_1789170 [compost metagenome]
MVAGFLEGGFGELVVGELELLDAQHVDRIGGQPVQDLLQAYVQGVHVPGGEFHDCCRPFVYAVLRGAAFQKTDLATH